MTIQAETLDLLEWPRLCQHLATFAVTKLGQKAAIALQIPQTADQTLTLLAQTQEVTRIESGVGTALSFDGICDIGDSLLRAALHGILQGLELFEIATTLAGMRRLRRAIEAQEEVPVLAAMVVQIRPHTELEQEIYRCIDEKGKVVDHASSKLADIRRQLKITRDRIQQTLLNILQRQSQAVQEQLITQRGDRYVIPVKAPQKDAVPGIVHDTSASGLTLYVEPNAVVPLGNQLRQLQRQEYIEEESIRRTLTEKVAEVQGELEESLAIATALDLATAKARYSNWLGANAPHFTNLEPSKTTPLVTLRRLRHPLLIWQQQHEQGHEVIPVDVQISPNIRVVAITGPNTGGKTVTLKTMALAALMAKVGLFIPAREPVELPWFEQVLADIGDEQSLEQSLSTFSGHIRRISRILEAVGTEENLSKSLVLLDEVGAGTDPSEGSALAIALLQHLADQALLTIATTHFGELKALKYQDERFENASVEFDEISLRPTYRLLWGIPGRSNALTIARRLGLNSEVIDRAQDYVGGANSDVNEVIAGLEAQRKRQETKADEASKLLFETQQLHDQVARKAAELKEREQQLRRQQEIAIQNAITEAKQQIAKAIHNLQKGIPTAKDAHNATEAVNKIAGNYLPSKTIPKPKPIYKPQVGERVRIPSLGQTAEVLSINEEQEELIIRFGMMKMTVPLIEVESLDGQKVEPKPKPVAVVAPPPPPIKAPIVQTSNNTVDIRGSRVADAEPRVEDAIAKAYSSGMGALWIVHGKGTGQLRKGVQEFLDSHPQIDRYELADQNSGGAGVTIAYLK